MAEPSMFTRYDHDHQFVMLHRFPYRVVYQDYVEVIAVAHAHRSSDYWQGRT